MKATLEFNLPEETTEHYNAVHGHEFVAVLWSLDRQLRLWLKNGNTFESTDRAIEFIRDELRDDLGSRGIVMDKS